MRPRRELELIRVLIVGAIVGAAVAAAVVVAISPLGFREHSPDVQRDAMNLLRDAVLIGFGSLVGTATNRLGRTTEPEPPHQEPPDATP